MGTRRARLGTSGWREAVRRFDADGAGVRQFCEREGLSVSSFQRWRSRLARSGDTQATAKPTAPRAAASFIDLGSLGASTPAGGASLEVRLEPGGAIVVRIARP